MSLPIRAMRLAKTVSHSCARTARPFTHHRPAGRRHLTTMAAAAPDSEWLQQDSRRMLHAVYRVGDMQKHIDFYTKLLGMKLLRQRDIPQDKYSNAFLGYGPEETNFAIELTYNYGVDSYDIGEGFGHFGVALPDVYAAADKIKAGGGTITREAGPVKGGSTVIAFARDPTGYMWELIQRKQTQEPLCQVMLRVGDLQRSIDYFTKVMGMKLLRTRDVPEYKYTLAFLGYGPEEDNCVLELTYNYGKTEYAKGNAYAQVALSTKDVYKTAEQIRAAGGAISREPGPVPGIGTKIVATIDPDGYKWVFVDEEDFNKELEEAAKQQ
uniref:Glyoxalase I n=1 Tax=Tetradesmus obliquus TaxID=3088 RepID=A0A383WPL6_TETOB|eukprot:jgi/Sobl393_1/14566/SZX79142.1